MQQSNSASPKLFLNNTPSYKMSAVDICVPTFKRKPQLERLLESLSKLDDNERLVGTIIVVDNDPSKSAAATCERFANILGGRVRYLTEPRKGVVHVRNTAIAASTAKYIAFIDDDEIAATMWLKELHARITSTGATAVVGYVENIFPPRTPKWILQLEQGNTFEDNQQLTSGSTANVILDRNVLEQTGITFNPEYALTGGEDTEFFARLHARGCTILYCATAIVYDPISPLRTNFNWHLRRNFRVGQTNALVYRPKTGLPLLKWILTRITVTLTAPILSAVIFPFSRRFGVKIFLTGIRGAGQISSLIDYRVKEYE